MARRFLLFSLLWFGSAGAQPLPFGSADDPLEAPASSFGRATGVAAAYVGPAFVGQSWRTVVAAEAEGRIGPFSAGLGGTLHAGVGGLYEPETDEWYDLARLIRYVRLDPRPGFPVYARLGPTRRMTFGHGHLVRGYRSDAAWDERTLGAEAAVASPGVTAGAFTGDVRLNGVVGGYAEVQPAPGAASPTLRSFYLLLGGVHDLGLPQDEAPTAFEVEAGLEAFRLAEFALVPFVSYAEYLHYGRSVGFGADVRSSPQVDVARVRLRVGAFVNGDGFVPGYVGPFYQVSNLHARIVTAESYFEGDGAPEFAGIPLGEVRGGVDVFTEAEVAAFRSFALSYHFRRHYGEQRLSDFSLRLAFRPSGLDGLRLALELERQGLGSFFSLFSSDLLDQNTLVFDIDYPVSDVLHLSIRSRYGYRRLPDAAGGIAGDGGERYLVQRRFEPVGGLRLRF